MVTNAAWFLAGLTVLAVGSEVMVRGATAPASRLGISPIVIGLTVVSIGTSMPELAVGVIAVGEGSGALAVGNIRRGRSGRRLERGSVGGRGARVSEPASACRSGP